ncbi:iron ABC transporter permease [Polynucleobacter sp. AM-26B4]|nr:iron ABC transporter permease [Polynucleobacter sp. AM-26B4]
MERNALSQGYCKLMNNQTALMYAIGLIVLITIALMAVILGPVEINYLNKLSANDQLVEDYILWQVRLPRILFAIALGASLGLAGALTQGLFRNPLADPGLLGVNSGAAAAAAGAIVFSGSLAWAIPEDLRVWVLPVAAFCGALGICFLLDRLARWLTPGSVMGLLLTGIAINALVAAFIGLSTYLANDEQLRNLSFWTMGSLAGANWMVLSLMMFVLTVAFLCSQRLTLQINALSLGEAVASQVGINLKQLRQRIIVMVAILSACAVAWCGMIGFISLIAPHIARAIAGPDHRQVLPLSMLLGGLLLLLADTLARTVAIPAEIPVGIFTALLGAPFFLSLLAKQRRVLM